MLRPVGPEVIRMSNRFLEAEETYDVEVMRSLSMRVFNNPSYTASMQINFPAVYQKMKYIWEELEEIGN